MHYDYEVKTLSGTQVQWSRRYRGGETQVWSRV
jgi:hypothetical protein